MPQIILCVWKIIFSGSLLHKTPTPCPKWVISFILAYTMVFYPTIGSTYFVKTQTYVALFGPHQLSIIFSGVMYLELSSL